MIGRVLRAHHRPHMYGGYISLVSEGWPVSRSLAYFASYCCCCDPGPPPPPEKNKTDLRPVVSVRRTSTKNDPPPIDPELDHHNGARGVCLQRTKRFAAVMLASNHPSRRASRNLLLFGQRRAFLRFGLPRVHGTYH